MNKEQIKLAHQSLHCLALELPEPVYHHAHAAIKPVLNEVESLQSRLTDLERICEEMAEKFMPYIQHQPHCEMDSQTECDCGLTDLRAAYRLKTPSPERVSEDSPISAQPKGEL